MTTQRKQPPRPRKCQICDNDAEFICSGCQNAFYCSQDHQRQHWKSIHKAKCKKAKQQAPVTPRGYGKLAAEKVDSIVEVRKSLRKSYYQSFAVEKYQECLALAKLMEEAEEKNLVVSSRRYDEFEHGATICLLIKTYIVLNERLTAKLRLQSYLKDNRILQDMSFLPTKTNPTPQTKQFLQKKLNLISTLANLTYSLGMPCINLYIKYTENIEAVFGEDSLEASNCYFLVGCFYAEEGHLLKAIACFKRAAQIRGEESGECYFNMGILYKRLGKNNRAIDMFTKALQKRCELYGDFTNQVAEVHENIGITYMEEFDFKTAMNNFETAYVIRKSDPMNPDFKRLTDLIVFLYKKLDAYINSGTINIQKPQIFIHLKETIKLNKRLDSDVQDRLNDHDMKAGTEIPPDWKEQFDDRKNKEQFKFDPNKFMKIDNFDAEAGLKTQEVHEDEKPKPTIQKTQQEPQSMFRLNISPEFISKLSSFQTYHLSELQLELEQCSTQYRAIVTANNSKFLRALDKQRAKQFREANPHIFGEIHIANQKPEESKKKKPLTPKLDLNKALKKEP